MTTRSTVEPLNDGGFYTAIRKLEGVQSINGKVHKLITTSSPFWTDPSRDLANLHLLHIHREM